MQLFQNDRGRGGWGEKEKMTHTENSVLKGVGVYLGVD